MQSHLNEGGLLKGACVSIARCRPIPREDVLGAHFQSAHF